ncbi:MAG: aminotransferase DegT [Elusimicrobia bacterium GWA2_56_46]|nr:MAG: aminotransferase DegT [Elusimicrobia bacterium GWA2_56_46]OGR55467.1 MAG: aminotransferase DegT [Elusimicrobia bacterium GWC2_56_31]HBW21935.1 LegC family aminotransferase [Elusimicrobiota bacterium]
MSKQAFIPLSVPCIEGNAWKYVKECLDTGWVSSAGKYVEIFEQKICGYTKAKYAVAVSNGTVGLYISLKLSGVEPGDEVLVPTLTFIAPVNAIRYLGAEPVFMDCDDFMNLDPVNMAEFVQSGCRLTKRGLINKKTGRRVKAILPVHIFGNPCDMQAIMGLARKYGLKVIEDATESLGSSYTSGVYENKFTGTIGDLGVYSFNGNKIVTTGSGGMIVTNDKSIAEKAKYLTTQAKDDAIRYVHNEVGYNFRLTNLLAALGVAQIEKLPGYIKIKKANYLEYKKRLAGIKGVTLLGTPAGTSPNYWFYSIIIDKDAYGADRERLMAKLESSGIQTRPIWFLNHLQKPYSKNQAFKIEKATWFWERVLNVPCSSGLTKRQVAYVAAKIKSSN